MERLSDAAIEITNELHTERLDYYSEYIPLIDAANSLAVYEDTGLEPEEIKKHEAAYNECLTRTYGPFKQKISQWLQAEQDGRLVELPFVAMVEQSLQDGKMKPMADQKHNGRYAVVYVDHNKWKSPLIDICGKPYNREEAENRMAALKGGEG